jgi:Bardet-Biedl syndrome 2 protein
MFDMDSMRKSYTELSALNNMMIGNYNIRSHNHETLLSALKDVNQMIQKASCLRIGSAKSRVIADCRAAVKANNTHQLLHIIKHGFEPSSMSSIGTVPSNR